MGSPHSFSSSQERLVEREVGRPKIGPQCVLNPIQSAKVADTQREGDGVIQDKKPNLFYLRDCLLRQEPQGQPLLFTKMNALNQLVQHRNQQVFRFAVEPLLQSHTFVQ